jgi:polyisoprenoid-binding protein YceI
MAASPAASGGTGGATIAPSATSATRTATGAGGGTAVATRTAGAAGTATGTAPASTATRSTGTATTAGGQRYVITPDTSKATYSVQETFVGRGLATAVGSTGTIAGDLTINKRNPSLSTIGTITVDISKLASDSGQRDNRIRQQWLESAKFPTATFVPKRLAGLPTTPYTDGQDLTFTIVGDLTVRNLTKEVTFDATGKIIGTTFTGTAKTGFNMTDFGFEPPSIAGVLNSENAVALTITIEAKQAQ